MREFTWIKKARDLFGDAHDGAPVGIGDDCAVLELDGETLVSTDTVVDGVHLDLHLITHEDAGWRALAVALSDLAAGGVDPRRPIHALVSLQAPAKCGDEQYLELARGLLACAQSHGCHIVGGDTVTTPGPLALTITVIGSTDRPVLRRGARVGDLVVVTGPLGAAGVGLSALRAGLSDPDAEACATAYRHPRAQLEIGEQLAPAATAMIDISDGLLQDLGHICEASRVGADIVWERLPVDAATRHTASRLEMDPIETAATFGDDYQLLACIPPTGLEELHNRIPGLTEIGCVTRGSEIRLLRGGQPLEFTRRGYEHGSQE